MGVGGLGGPSGTTDTLHSASEPPEIGRIFRDRAQVGQNGSKDAGPVDLAVGAPCHWTPLLVARHGQEKLPHDLGRGAALDDRVVILDERRAMPPGRMAPRMIPS